MTLAIPYESDGFPVASSVRNGAGTLPVTWDKILWAALTVGRPNRQYVFAHGRASFYEALFRLSLVRMALEQSGARGRRLHRTAAAKSLDPTEKGSVNYFLGMTVAKLFAAELLGVPWMLHLDVFRPQLNAVLSGRSRPDLVGQDANGRWIALECKGRVSPPNNDAKAKAKAQSQRIVQVNGVAPVLAIGAFAYFRSDTLQFFWRDPPSEPKSRNPIELVSSSEDWDHYYAPVRGVLSDQKLDEADGVLWTSLKGVDVKVGVHKRVWPVLLQSGAEARQSVLHNQDDLGPCNADGVCVQAGDSWLKPFPDRRTTDSW